jgi:exodeoxyribonuclease VII small subunit
MSPKKPAPEVGEPPKFEEALARLEAIVQELEGKELSLEETLTRYEEGSKLVRECAQRLDEAEQRIKTLSATEQKRSGGDDGGESEEDDGGPGLPF